MWVTERHKLHVETECTGPNLIPETASVHTHHIPTSREAIWRRFTGSIRNGLPQADPERLLIQESWSRSREAGVSPQEPQLRRASPAELDATAAEDGKLLAIAKPLVDSYSKAQKCRHVIALTNARGIILHSVGDPIWRALQGIWTGFDWSEQQMGTNGAGTALATDQVVVVVGPEHYLESFRNATCIGVPLHSPEGQTLGAVDFSSELENARPEQVIEVMELAATIEEKLGAALAAY